MATKGSIAKEEVINKILEIFPGSFRYEKEIRIPVVENSETLQIKCTLTCAKVNVENGGDNAMPGQSVSFTVAKESGFPIVNEPAKPMEPTEEEKANVETLLSALGF